MALREGRRGFHQSLEVMLDISGRSSCNLYFKLFNLLTSITSIFIVHTWHAYIGTVILVSHIVTNMNGVSRKLYPLFSQ
mgnify:CR=1 FL=1